MEVTEQKKRLRNEVLDWREQRLTDKEWAKKSLEVCKRLLESREIQRADRILSFAPFDHEVDLIPFFKGIPDTVLLTLPRVAGNELRVHKIKNRRKLILSLERSCPLDGYRRNQWGVIEPDPAVCSEVDPGKNDLVLVPGLVFDESGRRIGYGEGYYDKFLSGLDKTTLTVGVCFKEQLRKESIPEENHDVRVDHVVTEERIE